jgi:hypothetical protein
MELTQLLSRPLAIGREIAAKKIIKQFARKFGLVYLGHMGRHGDEHELIRGITLSAAHMDSYFCVGEHKGHDVSLVERRNTFIYSSHATQRYHWLIMQIDLRRDGWPHVFIDGRKHDEDFYSTLFMKFSNMVNASTLFAAHSPLFARTFQVFAPTDRFDDVSTMLGGEVPAMLAHHFKQFDYEVEDDHLLIYAENSIVTSHLLHEMLRVGEWLAAQMDKTMI